MKSRNYLILAGVIIILVLILVFNSNSNRTNFKIPRLTQIKQGEITGVVINKTNGTVTLKVENGAWIVNNEKYPGDNNKISNVISSITGLKISDLASESKNYALYQLDESNKINVKAYKGDTLLRTFDIGNEVSTGKHTYIKLPDHKEVYIAQDPLRSIFDSDADSFRNKNVMTFDRNIINAVSVTDKTGKTDKFFKQNITNIVKETNNTVQTNVKPVWTAENGRDVSEPELDQIVRDSSELSCDRFIYDKKIADFAKSKILFRILLSGKKDYTLSVYTGKDDQYEGVSSENSQPFILPKWKVDNMQVDKLYKKKEQKPVKNKRAA